MSQEPVLPPERSEEAEGGAAAASETAPPSARPTAPDLADASADPPPVSAAAPGAEATETAGAETTESAGAETTEAETGAAEVAAEPRTGRRWLPVALILTGGAFAVALVAVVGWAVVGYLSEEAPGLGDCLTEAVSVNEMTVVECGAADAYWSVIGVDGDWTFAEFEAAQPGEVCTAHPTSQQALWITVESEVGADTSGEVVCLATLVPREGSVGGAARPTR